MVTGRSELARQAPKDRGGQVRAGDPFGLMVHTTGSGIVGQALAKKRDPLEHAVEYYLKPDSYHPAYVGGWDGAVVQVASELIRAPHAAVVRERPDFLSGAWERKVSAATLLAWRRAWPAFLGPHALYPGTSANDAYVGLELLPLSGPDAPPPAFPGSSFTLAQHQLVVLLGNDLAARWRWPLRWPAGPRLLGHEDVNPLTRNDKGGGWDPGALRARPRFAWRWVRAMCAGAVDPGPIQP